MSNVPKPTPVGNTEITVHGRGKSARKVVHVEDWTLTVWTTAGEEPRIRDLDLAQRLGFDRPRKIRDLIRRSFEKGERPHVRPAVERTSMPRGGERETTVSEFWLTEAEALFIATRSRTAKATALTKEMIDVYIAARRGLLSLPTPVRPPSRMDVLAAQVSQMTQAVTAMTATVAALVARGPLPEDRPKPALPPAPKPIRPETHGQRDLRLTTERLARRPHTPKAWRCLLAGGHYCQMTHTTFNEAMVHALSYTDRGELARTVEYDPGSAAPIPPTHGAERGWTCVDRARSTCGIIHPEHVHALKHCDQAAQIGVERRPAFAWLDPTFVAVWTPPMQLAPAGAALQYVEWPWAQQDARA